METITASALIKNCKSGDIILFNGKKWYSKIIEWYCGSDISHVGIIIKDPNVNGKMCHGQFVLESRLYEDGSNGVRLTPLNRIIEEYEQDIYVRFLNCVRDSKFLLRIDNICFTTIGKKYDDNPWDWLKAICDVDIGNVHQTNKFWCSALVAYSYILLGFLNREVPWTIIRPSAFSSRYNIPILNFNCNLTNDIKIV